MKFLCDQMLGTLAKWLRVYGFDTYFANSEINDDEILNIAKNEDRILVTRDKELIHIARRENIKNIEIETTDLEEQLKIVLKGLTVDTFNILSRCIVCNNVISQIKKESIKDKVPKGIFDSNDEFWFCKHCDKIYWKGTHYQNMLERIDKIKE